MSRRRNAQFGGRLPLGMTDIDGNTALHLAALNDRDNAIESMISLGAQVEVRNAHGQTALHIACSRGWLKTVKVLVRQGHAYVDSEDDMGVRPIGIAARNGHVAVVEFLIAESAMLDRPSYDEATPLMEAVARAHVRVAEALLNAGANVHTTDDSGNTALHMAVEQGHVESVALLMEYRADPTVENYDLLTPGDIASCLDAPEILNLLRNDAVERNAIGRNSVDDVANDLEEKLMIREEERRKSSVQNGNDDDRVLDQLVSCPITMDVMRDPVMAVDGFCYERTAIAAWLKMHGTSPITKQRMSVGCLIPNRGLKFFIEEKMKR